eukprot:s505_g13.t2
MRTVSVEPKVQRQGCSSERGATVMMGLVQMQCNKTKKRGLRSEASELLMPSPFVAKPLIAPGAEWE